MPLHTGRSRLCGMHHPPGDRCALDFGPRRTGLQVGCHLNGWMHAARPAVIVYPLVQLIKARKMYSKCAAVFAYAAGRHATHRVLSRVLSSEAFLITPAQQVCYPHRLSLGLGLLLHARKRARLGPMWLVGRAPEPWTGTQTNNTRRLAWAPTSWHQQDTPA
jgi:hypothetical protein